MTKMTLKVCCEECGKKLGELGDNPHFYVLPQGFRVLCQRCYEDLKLRKQPWAMWYKIKEQEKQEKQKQKQKQTKAKECKDEKI